MLLTPFAIADVAARLQDEPDRLRVAVAPVSCAPLDFVRAAAPVFGSVRYMATPDGTAIAGAGVAWRTEAGGLRRFEALDDAWATHPPLPARARCFLGFSFSPEGVTSDEWAGFAASELVLPSATVIADARGSHLVVAVPPGADPGGVISVLRGLTTPPAPRVPGLGDHSVHSHPSGADWCAAIDEAIAAIQAGLLHKVVLARSVEVRTEMSIDPFEVVHHLGVHNPHCFVYGWQLGDAAFIGASPELLASVRGALVRSNPLAGSAQRGDGDEEDREVGRALMASAKDRKEHGLVVDDIAIRLRSLTDKLQVPDTPALRRIATVQHLSSDVQGTLTDGATLLRVVGALHPSPAVGGTPRAEALGFIDKLEAIDRGWYSGGVGWLAPSGDGDVALALRCALVSGSVARLYAGNGIVADSDPQTELVETRWKLRPVMNLLTAT